MGRKRHRMHKKTHGEYLFGVVRKYLVERDEFAERVSSSCSVVAKSKGVRPNDLQILLQV